MNEKYMIAALQEAQKAALIGEVPIGAVVVHHDQIIGRGHNLREHLQDATAHAEVLAIQEANQNLNSWRLIDCDLYVTIEPCVMCAGAIINAQLSNVYFGARNQKAGAAKSLYEVLEDDRLNHQVGLQEGIMAEEAGQIMKNFFKAARKRHKQEKQKKTGIFPENKL